VVWSAVELTDYLAAAINAVVSNKQDAYVLHTTMNLAAGTLQLLPSGGLVLLDVIRNGNGGAVRQIDRTRLDHSNPSWQGMTGTTSIQHFTFDKRDPKSFYVYPPAASGAQAEVVYGAVPARYTDTTGATVIPVDDIYENALYYFMLALAFSKGWKGSGPLDATKAQNYVALFSAAIGARNAVQIPYSPVAPDAVRDQTGDPTTEVR
jgi:hypothetical protein